MRLLNGALILFAVGYVVGVYTFSFARGPLILLLLSYLLGLMAIVRYKKDLRVLSAKLAIGAVIMILMGAMLIFLMSLKSTNTLPIATQWYYVCSVFMGLGSAFVSWQRAQPNEIEESVDTFILERPPTKRIVESIDWEQMDRDLVQQPNRLLHFRSLRRLFILNEQGCNREGLRDVIMQECVRLDQDTRADEKKLLEGDALTQAARLVEWGVQKIPEIAELDMSDVLMAKTIADIRALHSSVERKLVSHHQLLAIHPINRDTANEKCNQRAKAARAALPILEANDMKLTENLIAAHEELSDFSSVTGFQVVRVDKGFVTFEGNGRREALRRAFKKESIMVEVRIYEFADDKTQSDITRRVERVRRWKKVQDL